MRKIKDIMGTTAETVFNDMCYLDFQLWCEKVFGLEVKDFHMLMMNTVHTNRFLVIRCFRGGGKTTFLGMVYPIWLCWFRPGSHILFTAAELRQATKILDGVKEFIEDNEFLQELKPSNPERWSRTEVHMTNGSKIFCKAFTSSIKGVHVNYAFVDEIQDINDRDIFYKAISPTVSQKKGGICVVGTPNSMGDMLNEVYNIPEYMGITIPVILKPGESRWPEKFPMEEIQSIRKRIGEHAFQTQYMMNPKVESENAVFPAEWINSCFEQTERFLDTPAHDDSICVLGADFAMSKAVRADFDVYVVLEKKGGKSILRYAERHKGLSKDAKVQRLEKLYQIYKPNRMNLDPSGIGAAVVQELRQKALPVMEGEFHSRARNKLLVNLAAMIQPNKEGESALVIPRDPECPQTMAFTNKLVEELLSFREIKSEATGMISWISKGEHDDTVMALALACQAAEEQREFLDMVAF
jgi:hypothetical protein